MIGWRFVEQERLRVGDWLSEGCALVPFVRVPEVSLGDLFYHLDRQEIVKIKAIGVRELSVETARGGRNCLRLELFGVVKPVPAAPQKLGRLPKVGEKFWVELECEELDPGSAMPVRAGHTGWLSEKVLGFDLSAKRSELAAARARVAELEAELGGEE